MCTPWTWISFRGLSRAPSIAKSFSTGTKCDSLLTALHVRGPTCRYVIICYSWTISIKSVISALSWWGESLRWNKFSSGMPALLRSVYSCFFLMWSFSLKLWPKILPQILHLYLPSTLLWRKYFLGRLSWTRLTCLLRVYLEENDMPHISHGDRLVGDGG